MTALTDLAFTVHLDTTYETARERVEAALKEQGFGVVSEIDMRKTFKAKLDQDFRRYAILGACNPDLAIRALSTELRLGLLLPCNVIIYEDDAQIGATVLIVDPMAMLGGTGTAEIQAVAEEAHARLAKVAEALED